MPHPNLPVLAIGISQVIALIIFTVSVLSWFVNIIQGNQPNGAPRPKNRQRDPVQSELEKFLQEVVGGKQQEQKKPAPRPVQQQKQSRGPNDKKGGKGKTQPQRSPKSEPTVERPGQRIAQNHLQTSALGEGGRSHLMDKPELNRISAAVQADITGAVQQDIGSDSTVMATRRAGAIHPLALALRDPQGARQAILLGEILSKPKALR